MIHRLQFAKADYKEGAKIYNLHTVFEGKHLTYFTIASLEENQVHCGGAEHTCRVKAQAIHRNTNLSKDILTRKPEYSRTGHQSRK